MKSIIFALILMSCSALMAQNSEIIEYFESGKIKSIYSVHDGEIAFASYYESGKLMQTGFLKDGKRDRSWTNYTPDGKKLSIANFERGEKQGIWKIYDTNGRIAYEVNYNKDRIRNAARFDEAGDIIAYYK